MTQPKELNLCLDCHERRLRPPIIDYPTSPFIMCGDCEADTDLVTIANPHADSFTAQLRTEGTCGHKGPFSSDFPDVESWCAKPLGHAEPHANSDKDN